MKLLPPSLVIVVAGATVAPAWSDDRATATPPGLSLADVLAVAVRQSPELEYARLDVEVARGQLSRAVGIEDVTVGVRVGYDRTLQSGAVPVALGGVPDATHAKSGTLSIRRALPMGGSISVAATGTATTETTAGVATPIATSELTLNLTQPLLRGLGTTAAREARHAAGHELDAAALERDARARELVRAIVVAYWQVALARSQREVRKASLALAMQQLEYTEGAIRTGKIAKAEQLAVEQVIAVRRQDVLAAGIDVWERSLALRRLAGLEIDADAIEVEAVPLPKVDGSALDLRAEVALALERSSALAAFDALQRAAQDRLDAATNRLLPQFDLSITGGPAGVSTTVSSAVDKLTAGTGYTVGASLSLGYAIGRNDEHGLVTQARARAWRAKVDARDARALLIVETARAVQLAQASLESVHLSERAIELATENVEAEQRKFEDRKSTNFEVLRRQDELEQAKLRNAVATADYLSARAQLDALSGTILEKYRIQLSR